MSEVAHCDCVLCFDIGKEGSLVVDFEVEDSVLIWELEACRVDCGGWRSACDFKGYSVEGGEHREFKLKFVVSW